MYFHFLISKILQIRYTKDRKGLLGIVIGVIKNALE